MEVAEVEVAAIVMKMSPAAAAATAAWTALWGGASRVCASVVPMPGQLSSECRAIPQLPGMVHEPAAKRALLVQFNERLRVFTSIELWNATLTADALTANPT